MSDTRTAPIIDRANRVLLRLLSDADVQPIFEIFSDPAVMRYWSSPRMSHLSQAKLMIFRALEDYQAQTAYRFGVERKSDGKMIGACSLFHLDLQNRRGEIGYALGRPYLGHGYMNEALRALVGYAFEAINLNRLEADIDPRNTASAKTLERLGFQQEGLMRQRWIVGDEISDTAFYGLLASEWFARL